MRDCVPIAAGFGEVPPTRAPHRRPPEAPDFFVIKLVLFMVALIFGVCILQYVRIRGTALPGSIGHPEYRQPEWPATTHQW